MILKNKKYELLKDDYISHYGTKLFRIKCLKDFSVVRKGNLGGYLESETNLSQDGDAWVNGNVCVHGNAWVYGDAWVYGNARVYGNTRISGNAWQVFYVTDLLKLVKYDSKTRIYVKDKEFMQCTYLLISVPLNEANENYESIDQIADGYSHDHETNKELVPDDVEFWGHCSNLQAWAEHDYDTRLLHSNLSFPLLRKLSEEGDKKARKVFKDEIAYRYSSGYKPVQDYLKEEGYLNYLTREELKALK